MRWWLSLLIIAAALVLGAAATAERDSAEPQSTNSTLDTVFYDVLRWAVDNNVINQAQQEALSSELNRQIALIHQQPGFVGRTFKAVSSHLTVLNVLYFGGALIIIAGMTLLMAVGWGPYCIFMQLALISRANRLFVRAESLGGAGIFTVALCYMLGFVWVGQSFWHEEGWQLVGGILHTIALGMVPLGSYGLLRALGMWDETLKFNDVFKHIKPQFIILELATIVCGCIMIYFVRFSFLVAPIAGALWLLSMDSTPLFMNPNVKQRGYVSVAFGVAILAMGYYVDSIQVEMDFAFWLILAGCLSFSGGFVLLEPPSTVTTQTTVICAHMALLYLGAQLDRTTLTFFGAIGVAAVYLVMIVSYSDQDVTHFDVYIRVSSAVILLGMSLHAGVTQHIGYAEYILALFGLGAFNAAFVKLAGTSSEGSFLAHLLTNIGVLACAALFEDQMIDLYFWQLDASYLLIPSGVLGIVGNSMLAMFYELQRGLHRNIYCVYRVVLSVLVSLLTLGLPWHPIALVWAGVFSVLEYTWIAFAWKLPDFDKNYHLLFGHFINTLVAVVLASSFDLRFPFVVAVGFAAWVLVLSWKHWKKAVPVLSVLAILVAAVIDSKLLVAIGAGFFLRYASYLALKLFKNSLLFPFALVAVGISVIFVGVQYQTHHEAIREAILHSFAIDQILEKVVDIFENVGRADSAWNRAFVLLGWTATAVKALSIDITWVPFLIVALHLATVIRSFVSRISVEEPIVDLAPRLTNIDFSVSFPKDTSGHGVVISFTATKPADFVIDSATLSVEGEPLWNAVNDLLGSAYLAELIRGVYPLKLFPNRMSKKAIRAGSTEVHGIIQIGTGLKGESRVSHATIRSLLRKLVSSGDPQITVKVTYKSKTPKIAQGVLFVLNMKASRVLNSIKDNISLDEVFKQQW